MRENCLKQFDEHWNCLETNNQVWTALLFPHNDGSRYMRRITTGVGSLNER